MSTTKIWQEYERGVDYKTRIGLYQTVDLNERFYAGDQWVGIPHEGLPTPVVNFIRYATAWKIAAVTDRRLSMRFLPEGEGDGGDISIYARQLSDFCRVLWERLKMDYLTKEGLKQAAITGDYIQYFYWDPGIETGQAVTGDIATELIDNVNYYPGNPSSPDVQSQPYIILAFREMVDRVRDEAARNGCANVEDIVPDEENEYTAGDRGKVELSEAGKCNVLLKMWKQDGQVWCEKAVRRATVAPAKNTGLKRYPVALMNWDTRKNSCHGVAEVTGLIPNQVFINKILALSQLAQMQMSFPKVVYDRTRIREWTNKVAGAIPVNGDITGAAQYLGLPNSGYDAWKGLSATLETTMRMMGANEVTLGNIKNPQNTSAFIATRDAAMVPLQSQQERFYNFIEDVGLIWLDFIQQYYTAGRMIPIEADGQRVYVPIPEDALRPYTLRLKLDVGPSSTWSEVQTLQSLDNLLKAGKLTFRQYLERLPDGHIPKKAELLAEVEAAENAQKGQEPGAAMPGGAAEPPRQAGAAPQGAPGPQMPQMPEGAGALQSAGGMASAPQGMAADMLAERIREAAAAGNVHPEAAREAEELAAQGAPAEVILGALARAAEQGRADRAFVNTMLARMRPRT